MENKTENPQKWDYIMGVNIFNTDKYLAMLSANGLLLSFKNKENPTSYDRSIEIHLDNPTGIIETNNLNGLDIITDKILDELQSLKGTSKRRKTILRLISDAIKDGDVEPTGTIERSIEKADLDRKNFYRYRLDHPRINCQSREY
jgi:hypothetical protein